MLFSSIVFIFLFLPATLIIYYLLSWSRTLQNIWLLLASLIFYAWGEPVNVAFLIASIFINWLMGLFISKNEDGRKRKWWLIFSCVFNIGMLFVFKYLGFTVNSINSLAGKDIIKDPGLALPVGISFYTFQAMSYVIDVYRKDIAAEKNPFNVGLYISFFPQLIAGPIVKYSTIAGQIRERRTTLTKIAMGSTRFVMGLAKKLIIANSLAECADRIFSWSTMGNNVFNTSVCLSWLGAITYTLQIYFDFSGYSDMAIALSLMFGFKINENFNYPYAARSVNEFWKRWHISLTSWFREYVYIPLGGSRAGNRDHMVKNMFIVWLLTGIWHGASWNFIFWGLWHFSFQLAERITGYDRAGRYPVLMRVYTLFVVVTGWVLFRADDLYQAGIYFKNMAGINGNTFSDSTAWFMFREYWMYIVLGILFSMPIVPQINKCLYEKKAGVPGRVFSVIYPVSTMALFIICVSYLVRGGYNPFIYFDF